MTDHQDLVARLREWAENESTWSKQPHAVVLQDAADAIEALAKDAERYRWLRNEANGDNWWKVHDDCGRDLLDGAELDAAIDAARDAPSATRGCSAPLADPWWHFCGETDMGQTAPVLCEQCGGTYKRKDAP